jgi:hypothetical protein
MTKLFITLFFLISFLGFSQTNWTVKSDFWSGVALHQNGSKITINQAIEKAKGQESIISKLKSAKTNRTIGTIISYPGAFAFGYVLGQSLNSNGPKPNWAVGGAGAGLMIGGMIFQGSGSKKLREASEEYNNLNKVTIHFQPELNLYCSENGLGIKMTF